MLRRKGLSERQRRILDYIRQFIQDHGYPPSVRDIQRGCGISSTSVVDYNLHILHREGYIRRSPEVSRGIELLEPWTRAPRPEVVSVPVVGYIAAGQPLPSFAAESAEPLEVVDLPSSLVRGGGPFFGLRVKGLSMIDDLINEGDIVILQPLNRQPYNGEMVAAWLRSTQETTLKRFYREGPVVRLQPANSQMEPIRVPAEDVEVKGRVVGVLRWLT